MLDTRNSKECRPKEGEGKKGKKKNPVSNALPPPVSQPPLIHVRITDPLKSSEPIRRQSQDQPYRRDNGAGGEDHELHAGEDKGVGTVVKSI